MRFLILWLFPREAHGVAEEASTWHVKHAVPGKLKDGACWSVQVQCRVTLGWRTENCVRLLWSLTILWESKKGLVHVQLSQLLLDHLLHSWGSVKNVGARALICKELAVCRESWVVQPGQQILLSVHGSSVEGTKDNSSFLLPIFFRDHDNVF